MSPATPATGKPAKANMNAMGTGSPKVDPSPASTYGDSVASDISDDFPATHGIENDESVLLHGVAHLGLDDEKPVEVSTKLSGSYSIDIAKNKVKNDKGYTPSTERYSPPFVRNSILSRADDPFKSQTPIKNDCSSSGSPKSQDKRSRMSEDWRSGSSSSDKSQIFSPTFRNTQRRLSFSRDNTCPVSATNAQAVYLPAFCVFVANLLQTENEDTLEAAVTQVFREFGTVFVKIRRDGKNMPFAFCQYTNQRDAERAIRDGKGRPILGRPCRCEKAKAHRLFFIERNYGDAIKVDEARELLTPFGKLTDCYSPSIAERTALNLNEGVMVQFELFECGREAQAAFREHELYRMQAIANSGVSPGRAQNSSIEAARAYNARYDIDRRSIFVGNLPVGTTEMQLHALFSHYGTIENILLVENPSKVQGGEKYAFAFVEYSSPVQAQNAKAAKNHFNFMGKTLRVTEKNSEHGSRNRLSLHTGTGSFQPRATLTAPYHSPAPPQPEQHASTLTQMSPPMYGSPAYGSPYCYPYSPFYTYSYTADGQYAYYPTPYQTNYMTGSPGYPSRNLTEVAGTSSASQPYYQYPAPAPCHTSQGNEQYISSSYGSFYPHSTMASSSGPEDRSATPTPAGHNSATESPMKS